MRTGHIAARAEAEAAAAEAQALEEVLRGAVRLVLGCILLCC